MIIVETIKELLNGNLGEIIKILIILLIFALIEGIIRGVRK